MGKAQEKHKKSLQWLGSGLFWQAVVGIEAVCLGSGPFGWALGPAGPMGPMGPGLAHAMGLVL